MQIPILFAYIRFRYYRNCLKTFHPRRQIVTNDSSIPSTVLDEMPISHLSENRKTKPRGSWRKISRSVRYIVYRSIPRPLDRRFACWWRTVVPLQRSRCTFTRVNVRDWRREFWARSEIFRESTKPKRCTSCVHRRFISLREEYRFKELFSRIFMMPRDVEDTHWMRF